VKKLISLLLLMFVGALTTNPIYTLASILDSSSSEVLPSSSEEEALVLAVNETGGFQNATNYSTNYRSVGSTFFNTNNKFVYLSNGANYTAGSFFTKNKVFLANSENAGFSTFFEFSVFAANGYADGFTFIVSRDINVLGNAGGAIGYGGITNSIAVIFDNYDNGGQPPLCLSLGVNGAQGNCVQYAGPASGNYKIWIDYIRASQTLEVRINPTNLTRPINPNRAWTGVSFDQIGNEFYTGFTASTGGASQYAYIKSWYFAARYVTNGIDPTAAGTFVTDNIAPITPFVEPYLRNGTWFFKEDGLKVTEAGLTFIYTLGNNNQFYFLNSNSQATFTGNDRTLYLYALDDAGNRSPAGTYQYHRATYILNYPNALNEFFFYPRVSNDYPITILLDLYEPVRPGFTFLGWGTTPSQTTNLLTQDSFLADKIFFAQWRMVDATIQFNTNGGNVMPEIITNIRDGLTLPEPPTKANHTFVGWYLDEALTQPFDVNQFNYLSTTLYAKWQIDQFNVTLANASFGEDVTVVSDYGTILTPPSATHENYFVFDGWFADEACTVAHDFASPITSSITVYAKWVDIRPNLAFIDALNQINNPLTTEDEDALIALREQLNQLTPDQRKYLDDDYVEELIALETHMVDLLAVEAVVLQIDALPRIVSLEDGDLIQSALEAYMNLTDEQKALFPLDRDHHLNDLIVQYSNLDQARGVELLTLSIPQNYSIEDINAIETAYENYLNLTPEEQAMVAPEVRSRLFQAVSQLNQLKNANDFVTLVLSIGPTITEDDEARIQLALSTYDALNATERSFIDLMYVQLLATYAKQYQDWQIAIPVDVQLLALPVTITLDDEQAIREAIEAYEALSQDQQTFVSDEARLRLQQAIEQLNILLAPVDPEPPIPPSPEEGFYFPWIIFVVLLGWGGGFYLVQLRKKYLL
jgi:uncharacterized repeat protein (TIGR02543 family)